MSDFFDELAQFRAAAYAPVKADMDDLVGKIEGVKTNLSSAQTREQINTALQNVNTYKNQAKRYKTTKILADTVENLAHNRNLEYSNYELAIKEADDYLSKETYMDKVAEWKDLGNLATKEAGYASKIDFIVMEQDKVNKWLNQLTPVGQDGKRTMTGFKYNKNKY